MASASNSKRKPAFTLYDFVVTERSSLLQTRKQTENPTEASGDRCPLPSLRVLSRVSAGLKLACSTETEG